MKVAQAPIPNKKKWLEYHFFLKLLPLFLVFGKVFKNGEDGDDGALDFNWLLG